MIHADDRMEPPTAPDALYSRLRAGDRVLMCHPSVMDGRPLRGIYEAGLGSDAVTVRVWGEAHTVGVQDLLLLPADTVDWLAAGFASAD